MSLTAALAVAAGVGSLIKTGYDLWSNHRDFDYQKSLQQEVFNREDNAVQRRMNDLTAAGLNPNLAAGNAASAGSVVGRSNTPGLSGNSVGTALDVAQHVAQLRNLRQENEILQNQKSKVEAEARLANNEAVLDNLNLATMLGLKTGIKYDKNGNIMAVHKGFNDVKWLNQDNNLFLNYMKWNWENAKNSADLLQKDNEWYTADKIADYFGKASSAYSSLGSGTFNFNRRR